jgi:hypothetical protein
MAHRFVHCAGRIKLTEEQVVALRAEDPTSEDGFALPQWCELSNGHDGVPHHAEVLSVFEGDDWWLRWDESGLNELVRLGSCEVESGPQGDIHSEACGLFPDHPGRHGWAEQDPEMCAHGSAGTPQQISEAVTFDGRYISVFEARCLGCSALMVQVRILDPQQARPPRDLGATVSMWSLLGADVRL